MGEQGWDRVRLLDLDPPLQARCWAVLVEVGMESFGKEESCSPPWHCYSGHCCVPKKGCCHFSLPLGNLYRDVVGIRGLKAFPA